MADVRLRRLNAGDMPSAAIVHRKSFDARLPSLAGLHTPKEDRNYWSRHLFETHEIWCAERDEKLLGVIAFRKDWIEQLYILPEAQGQGIGSGLLDVAKAAYADLRLWTFRRNTDARRFYEARGFVAVEETDGAGNEEKEPDVLYRWIR